MSLTATVSFRDPSGQCLALRDRVLRWVGGADLASFQQFLDSSCASSLVEKGDLVSTRALEADEVEALAQQAETRAFAAAARAGQVFEHERIPFASHPYEWAPEMLRAAGELTIHLARQALAEGYGLKDATPYNVLFRGPKPVFIDVPSFERRTPGDAVWAPYAQFIRTFILPLLAHRTWGMKLADVFLTHRDGIEPEEMYRHCGWGRRLTPRFLFLVALPTWLAGKADDSKTYRPPQPMDPEKAQFILNALLNRLERTLRSVAPPRRQSSTWSDYMATHSYAEQAFKDKEAFVRGALKEFQPARVIDVGANTGHFSFLAAREGASVVSIDYDPVCVGAIWEQAGQQQLDILPLVVDLSRPTPAVGWRNRECSSFLDRATGAFDGALMLAVIHHLLVSERIPLPEIVRMAADLVTRFAVIEFVGPQDSMFRRLTRGRDALHADLSKEVFERACAPHFEVVRSVHTPDTHRWLYLLKKRQPAS